MQRDGEDLEMMRERERERGAEEHQNPSHFRHVAYKEARQSRANVLAGFREGAWSLGQRQRWPGRASA